MENKDLYELLIKYKKGDKQCFHVFYENLKKPVFYNIYSILKNKEASEDILQETFIKLLENIDKINSQDSILGYLMVISKNLSLDYLKKNKSLKIDDEDIESKERTAKLTMKRSRVSYLAI
ncbi:MAG: sigma-70 family RNA polymerase sigma factor [Bacilli bacterium]